MIGNPKHPRLANQHLCSALKQASSHRAQSPFVLLDQRRDPDLPARRRRTLVTPAAPTADPPWTIRAILRLHPARRTRRLVRDRTTSLRSLVPPANALASPGYLRSTREEAQGTEQFDTLLALQVK